MKIILYVLGLIALAFIIYVIVMMIKNKTSLATNTQPPTTGGGTVIPPGTTINLGGSGGGTTTVLISELTQKLMTGFQFADNPLILNGTIAPVLKRLARLTDMSFNWYFVWDTTYSKGTIDVYTTNAGSVTKDPNEMIQGIKRKNLIWQQIPATGSASWVPSVNGVQDFGGYIRVLKCSFYFVDGTEKVFPIPQPFTEDYASDSYTIGHAISPAQGSAQWKCIDFPATQTKINTYTSTHPTP